MVEHQEITFGDARVPVGCCTRGQFQLLMKIVSRVTREYSAQTDFAEISRGDCPCYVVEVFNKDPATVTDMNFSLAEAVCDESALDDCELIAYFSSPAIWRKGRLYGDKQS
jgi:hypothetical protein